MTNKLDAYIEAEIKDTQDEVNDALIAWRLAKKETEDAIKWEAKMAHNYHMESLRLKSLTEKPDAKF